ncbi:hypothetical protein QBC32DRAFT_34997 [Pseudoneurospora amorphoporcata]|uniref:Uncharacterized protein n=1 Tax=Pseudoneurospora amorphoporcata TaxID=241081 RepID=A0AAN6NPB7_9PEZI|nr:hypothetical protein QBC32DRAFT_34997 [Pseudoneurospora amorphoporcata]
MVQWWKPKKKNGLERRRIESDAANRNEWKMYGRIAELHSAAVAAARQRQRSAITFTFTTTHGGDTLQSKSGRPHLRSREWDGSQRAGGSTVLFFCLEGWRSDYRSSSLSLDICICDIEYMLDADSPILFPLFRKQWISREHVATQPLDVVIPDFLFSIKKTLALPSPGISRLGKFLGSWSLHSIKHFPVHYQPWQISIATISFAFFYPYISHA